MMTPDDKQEPDRLPPRHADAPLHPVVPRPLSEAVELMEEAWRKVRHEHDEVIRKPRSATNHINETVEEGGFDTEFLVEISDAVASVTAALRFAQEMHGVAD